MAEDSLPDGVVFGDGDMKSPALTSNYVSSIADFESVASVEFPIL